MQQNIQQYFGVSTSGVSAPPCTNGSVQPLSLPRVVSRKRGKCLTTRLSEQQQQQVTVKAACKERSDPLPQLEHVSGDNCDDAISNISTDDSYQPSESPCIIKQPKQSRKYNEKIANTWLKLYRWLLIKEDKKGEIKMFCNKCIETKQHSTFSRKGSDNFQLSALVRHQDSIQHKKAIKQKALINQTEKSFEMGKNKEAAYLSEKYIKQKLQMRTVYWMGKEEIASTKCTSLMKLQVNKLISVLNKFMTHFLIFLHESTSVTNIM